jgi:hypothetical protein
MARIPYPETQHLPHELRDLLRQTNLNIFLMWAHSVNTIGIVAQLGAAQFAKLELPRSIRELVTLLGARQWGRLRVGPTCRTIQSSGRDGRATRRFRAP